MRACSSTESAKTKQQRPRWERGRCQEPKADRRRWCDRHPPLYPAGSQLPTDPGASRGCPGLPSAVVRRVCASRRVLMIQLDPEFPPRKRGRTRGITLTRRARGQELSPNWVLILLLGRPCSPTRCSPPRRRAEVLGSASIMHEVDSTEGDPSDPPPQPPRAQDLRRPRRPPRRAGRERR